MENFTIKSKIISGSVTKTDDESSSNIEINIKIHEDIDPDCVVRAYFADKDTKEVIKEFPPEKTLDMIAKVWEVAGILVDEKR